MEQRRRTQSPICNIQSYPEHSALECALGQLRTDLGAGLAQNSQFIYSALLQLSMHANTCPCSSCPWPGPGRPE